MSDENDRIRAALTDEWQSTAEIARKAGLEGLARDRRISKVYYTLKYDLTRGLVEKRRNYCTTGTMDQWRKAA